MLNFEDKSFIIGTKNGKLITAKGSELITNALEQEAAGIKPSYSWYDYIHHEPRDWRGWLVANSWNYGVYVVYRRDDGKMVLVTGVQGDFCCC